MKAVVLLTKKIVAQISVDRTLKLYPCVFSSPVLRFCSLSALSFKEKLIKNYAVMPVMYDAM